MMMMQVEEREPDQVIEQQLAQMTQWDEPAPQPTMFDEAMKRTREGTQPQKRSIWTTNIGRGTSWILGSALAAGLVFGVFLWPETPSSRRNSAGDVVIAILDYHRHGHRQICSKKLTQSAEIDYEVLSQVDRVLQQELLESGRRTWIQQQQDRSTARQMRPERRRLLVRKWHPRGHDSHDLSLRPGAGQIPVCGDLKVHLLETAVEDTEALAVHLCRVAFLVSTREGDAALLGFQGSLDGIAQRFLGLLREAL